MIGSVHQYNEFILQNMITLRKYLAFEASDLHVGKELGTDILEYIDIACNARESENI